MIGSISKLRFQVSFSEHPTLGAAKSGHLKVPSESPVGFHCFSTTSAIIPAKNKMTTRNATRANLLIPGFIASSIRAKKNDRTNTDMPTKIADIQTTCSGASRADG
jgi:hypothetical protein